MATTEEPEDNMGQNSGNWHEIPGQWKWFSHQDLLAALAPKFLACNEGGAEVYIDTVKRGYETVGAGDNFQISYYPKFADPKTRNRHGELPKYGLSDETCFECCYVDAPDHSFRAEPSVRLLKKCFGM